MNSRTEVVSAGQVLTRKTVSRRRMEKDTRVAVIGGGPVGSMCACLLARRGYSVCLYECREDIRKAEMVQGRSINLAVSLRGRKALKEIDLEDRIVQEHGIPMKGRMIHNLDGTKYEIAYDSVSNQCIYSVSRRYLNEILLTAAEKYENVKIAFNSKLLSADLRNGSMTLLRTGTGETFQENADLIIGADGAHSRVRREMMKFSRCNFSQKYIEHGYLELCIPAGPDGDFAMEPNYLHIWPRGNFMMIALPNQEKSWTVTLFMPFAEFDQLQDPEQLIRFFRAHFPDAIPLMTEDRLIRDFFSWKPSSLISIKCKPYHFEDKAILIGDAAHAMVPFYGQGLNAGLEDCIILNRLLLRYGDRLDLVLQEFSDTRNEDAEAICHLAMYNYIEMRDLVNRRSYLLRKKLDTILYSLFPKFWVPLYNSVTFSDTKYSQCVRNRSNQDKILLAVALVLTVETVCFLYWICNSYRQTTLT